MASKIILFLSFVALSNAGFVWVDDDDDDTFPKLRQAPKFKPAFDPFVFEPITFKPFVFEPITFKPIDVNYKPKPGEKFIATSSSSHHEETIVDGVKKSSGGSDIVTNVDGNINEEGVEYKKGDKPKKNKNNNKETENNNQNND